MDCVIGTFCLSCIFTPIKYGAVKDGCFYLNASLRCNYQMQFFADVVTFYRLRKFFAFA